MSKSAMSDVIITTASAAGILGLSVRKTRQHAENGTIPAVRLGSAWIFKLADVERMKGRLPRRGRPLKS